ncbi:hypothetical protein ACH5RR_007510 [Cinchona calisaya]|uniref:Uncharacterized protein n=1 Tax=Cinchona calisaya TaxID=153742 RepID=A0ABD3ASI3_9GENT
MIRHYIFEGLPPSPPPQPEQEEDNNHRGWHYGSWCSDLEITIELDIGVLTMNILEANENCRCHLQKNQHGKNRSQEEFKKSETSRVENWTHDDAVFYWPSEDEVAESTIRDYNFFFFFWAVDPQEVYS